MKRILALVLAVLTSTPAVAAPVIWGPSGPQIIQSGQLFAKDGSIYNKSAEKNYLANWPLKANWTTTGSATVAVDTTAAELPRANTTATGIKVTGGGSAGTVYQCFTLDSADYAKKLKVQWDQAPISGYVAGDFEVDVYSGANCGAATTRLSLSTDSSGTSPLPNLTGTYRTTFDAPGSAAAVIKVAFTWVANSHSLVFSDLVVGPGIVTQGAAVSQWTTCTGSGNWSTNTTYGTCNYRRIGDTAEVEQIINFSGVPDATQLSVNIPANLAVDTTKISNTTQFQAALGNGVVNAGGSQWPVYVVYGSTTTVQLGIVTAPSTPSNIPFQTLVDKTHPGTIGNGSTIELHYSVPIAAWAGSGAINISQNDVEYVYNTSTSTTATDTTSFGYGPSGAQIQAITSALARRVRFPTPIQPSDSLQVEVSADQIKWMPLTGATIPSNSGSAQVQPLLFQNGVGYGIGQLGFVNSTDVDVNFAQYSFANGATFGAAGAAWSTNAGNFYWRVRKIKGGNAVGFGLASTTSAGLVPSGTYDGSAAWTFGPSNAGTVHTINGVAKINTSTTSGFTVGSGGSGSNGILYFVTNSTNQTCNTTCSGTRPSSSAGSAAATCLMAWTPGAVAQACTVTAASQFCLCVTI